MKKSKAFSKFTLQLLCLCLISNASAEAQIVNIESARIHTDTTGLSGDIFTYFSLSKNVNEVFSADINAHVQLKTKKNLFLLLGNYGFLRSAGEKIFDNTFFHFRYNRKLNEWLRWEAFTQVQRNTINFIESRFLVGTGPRFKILDKEKVKLYLASLIMYEHETETSTPKIRHSDMRNSSYVSATILPHKNLEIISTTFYQPLLASLKDYRILNQTALKVKATEHFRFSLTLSYLFDSKPALGAPEVNYRLGSGVGWEF